MIKMINKKGFTLAELLMALTVIGILAAILVPTLIASVPEFGKLRAKKGYTNFAKAVSGMIDAGPYDMTEGNLDSSYFISGTSQAAKDGRLRFFCNNLANTLNIKDFDCTMDKVNTYVIPKEGSYDNSTICPSGSDYQVNDGARNAVCSVDTDEYFLTEVYGFYIQRAGDEICGNYFDATTDTDYNIKTSDNILFSVQLSNFSHNATRGTGHSDFGNSYDHLTRSAYYAVICMDTDYHRSKSNMYSILVGKDGSVIPGEKLTTLLYENGKEL